MDISQILILILLIKPQIDHVHLSYHSPLQYHQIPHATSEIINRMEAIIQHIYIPLLFKLLSQHPHHHNFPPIPTTSPKPSSPNPSLPPLDLTPPTQNTSESDISDDLFDLLYNDTNDNYGIPFEQLPSRPMVNYPNDRELEEDYEIGWERLEQYPGPLIAPYTGFWQYLLDPLKTKPEDFINALFDDTMYMIMA